MTDAVQVFNETVSERSIQKKSASHKKNGASVPKLGNKRMSRKEINEKHGPVKSWNLEDLMSYSEFTSMSNDLKAEYINKLCDKYDIGIKHVSRYLFEQGDDGLIQYLRKNNILKQCNPQKARGKTGLKQFRDDIIEWNRLDKVIRDLGYSGEELTDGSVKFITKAEYVKMPAHERLRYINALIKKYNVSVDYIGRLLFDFSHSCIRNYFRDHKIDNQLEHVFRGGPDERKQINEAFVKDVNEWKVANGFIEASEPEVEHPQEAEAVSTDISEAFNQIPEEPVSDELMADDVPDSICEIKSDDDITNNSESEKSVDEYPEEDPMEFHDATYSTSYIRNGINMDEISVLNTLFANRRVLVEITITEL